MARSITKVFSATGTTNGIEVKKGESLFYKADLASFVGTLVLRKSSDGGQSYTVVETIAADVSGSVLVAPEDAVYFFYCSAFTSGTATVTLTDQSEDLLATRGFGTPNGSTVEVMELFDGDVLHKTIIQMTSTPVTVTSITTGNGIGGVKVYDLPEGYISMLGCVADLSLSIHEDDQADYTDATPEGDIGVGSVIITDPTAFSTDATDDDYAAGATITMAAYQDLVACAPQAAAIYDGSSTAKDVTVNTFIDAADIDDATVTTLYVSGTVIITWANLGDV